MRRALLAIVSTAAGLVFLLSFKTHSTSAAAAPPTAVSGTGSTAGAGASGVTSTPTASSSTSAVTAKTVSGDAAQTRYGPVQVKISVKNGKLVAVDATEYPQSGPRDAQINAYAIPALDKEALAAGSAHIDTVSGATYTSGGYVTSLQKRAGQGGPVRPRH